MLTVNDIRFTRKENVLYATVCGWRPDSVRMMSLGTNKIPGLKVKAISLLGSDKPVDWQQGDDELKVTIPKDVPYQCAYVFKIAGDGLFPERAVEYLPVKLSTPRDKKIAALRITLPGPIQRLSIAEVITIDTSKGPWHNAAPKGSVTLSSCVTDPALAIDLNQNGHPGMNSVALTKAENNPWLLLTLDEPRQIGEVEVFAGMENFRAFSENGMHLGYGW